MALKAVFETNELEAEQSSQVEATGARIHVLEALPSHRERDGGYPTVARLSDTIRVIECKDGLQWILQRRSGDQWKGLAYCRTRAALIREASVLLGHVPQALLELSGHYDGIIEAVPRCGFCGRIATKPTGLLPRHMFCIAVRKGAGRLEQAVSGAECGMSGPAAARFGKSERRRPSLTSQGRTSVGESPFGAGCQ
jgi:hypothetical protein